MTFIKDEIHNDNCKCSEAGWGRLGCQSRQDSVRAGVANSRREGLGQLFGVRWQRGRQGPMRLKMVGAILQAAHGMSRIPATPSAMGCEEMPEGEWSLGNRDRMVPAPA